ncbi:MAG: phosphate ABC transporter permease PstA [Gloeomargarita sp. SKYBB_i_bin120]|nr:phosphate ABC transporter permease PstA [Gloeomargarita sp. SKYB120]MDW8177012.1 phosphate ABC transporter permease PstA [Gloeomargarita sp. SKYBB_i_bin120]
MMLRRLRDWLLSTLVTLALVLVLGVLGAILGYVSYRGMAQWLRDGWTVLTALPPAPLDATGGLGPALVGSAVLLTLATLMALPVSVLAAVYLSEFCPWPWLASGLNLGLEVLAGLPSILVGVFVFGVMIVHTRRFSALAGALALALIMLPILTTTTRLALAAVPQEMRQAAWALGATRWQMVTRILLPQAWPGLRTGLTLALARAAGETAPLLFTALFSRHYLPLRELGPEALLTQPVASLPVLIYTFALSPFANQQELAWAAALVLIAVVLGLNWLAQAGTVKG